MIFAAVREGGGWYRGNGEGRGDKRQHHPSHEYSLMIDSRRANAEVVTPVSWPEDNCQVALTPPEQINDERFVASSWKPVR
jgi:hypothetical protein